MTLDQYLVSERARLNEFERQWREAARAKPSMFPLVMDEGAWFESYTAFDEGCSLVGDSPEEEKVRHDHSLGEPAT